MNWELTSSDGYRIRITGDIVKVGRSSDNTVVLNDPAVSRFHLSFYQSDGELIVEDAGSANGFTVNGKVSKGAVRLTAGDRVGIGSREYLVQPEKDVLSLESQSLPRMPANPATGTSSPSGATHSRNPEFIKLSEKKPQSPISSNRTRLLFIGVIAIFAVYFSQLEKIDRHPASTSNKDKKSPLPEALSLDGRKNFRQKGITEVQAEAKFKETLRDYYNRNYSRAIIGFNDVLILDSTHEEARYHLEMSKLYLQNELQSLYADAERSYGNLQYRRAKAQTMKVLTYIAEQIPSYGRKIAEAAARNPEPTSSTQDENLLIVPCKSYFANPEICFKAQKLLRAARQQLGDEDSLKAVQ